MLLAPYGSTCAGLGAHAATPPDLLGLYFCGGILKGRVNSNSKGGLVIHLILSLKILRTERMTSGFIEAESVCTLRQIDEPPGFVSR